MAETNFTAVAEKTCTKCGECKPGTSEYFLVRDTKTGALKTCCKVCGAKYRKTYYASNKDALLADNKAYRKLNIEAVKAKKKSHYAANRSVVIDHNQAYREANREASRERAANYTRKKAASDPVYAMRLRVCALIGTRLRSGGYSKKSRGHEILGCDWCFFKMHMERQFLPGMEWGNRDKWHIDHITPMATAKTEGDVIALSHFTNLRPMWAVDNIRKSNGITHLI
jgi:hypothetical protein